MKNGKDEVKEQEEELNGILEYEFKRVKELKLNEYGIEIEKSNDFTKWNVTLNAPEDSDYKGGKYKVLVEFKFDYPYENPEFTFQTKIYHCNVDENGKLKVNWLMRGMKIDYILPRLLTLFYIQDDSIDEKNEKCILHKNNPDEFKENIKKNVEEIKNN